MSLKNINLDHDDVKTIIYKYINTHIQSQTSYVSITNLNILEKIKTEKYMLSYRMVGMRIWMVFLMHKNIYYAVSLSQDKKKMNLFPVKVSINSELYNGTLMEGTLYQYENETHVIIDDVYMLAGVNQLTKTKYNRINNLTNILSLKIIITEKYYITVIPIININENEIANLFEKIKINPNIKEIIFYPNLFGDHIYVYEILETDRKDQVIRINPFYLQKTNKPDVYSLLSVYNKNKIGIAFIPDIKISKQCKQWFIEKKTNILLVECYTESDDKYWIPDKIIE